MERMKRELALDHAAGKIADETYLARVAVIRQEMAALATSEPPAIAPADKVVAKLRQLPETWAKATPAGRVELLNSIYERITVKGRVRGGPTHVRCVRTWTGPRAPRAGPAGTGVGIGAPDRS